MRIMELCFHLLPFIWYLKFSVIICMFTDLFLFISILLSVSVLRYLSLSIPLLFICLCMYVCIFVFQFLFSSSLCVFLYLYLPLCMYVCKYILMFILSRCLPVGVYLITKHTTLEMLTVKSQNVVSIIIPLVILTGKHTWCEFMIRFRYSALIKE